MKWRSLIIMVVVLVLVGVFASAALAGSSIITQIINDASDGTISGHYTAAQVRAALSAVESNPAYSMYSDIAGVLQDYLTSLTASASHSVSSGTPQTAGQATATAPTTAAGGQLDYTGGEPFIAIAVGGALLAAGALLRRRWT